LKYIEMPNALPVRCLQWSQWHTPCNCGGAVTVIVQAPQAQRAV
jgi:hypothetical protein